MSEHDRPSVAESIHQSGLYGGSLDRLVPVDRVPSYSLASDYDALSDRGVCTPASPWQLAAMKS